jgi:hypothetical protein
MAMRVGFTAAIPQGNSMRYSSLDTGSCPSSQTHLRHAWVVVLALALAGLGGCVNGSEGQLRTRAAFDMKCPEDQLQVTDLGGGGFAGGGMKGVDGCGQRATYVYQPHGNSWALNATSAPPPR